jgi:hypothetical protein
VELPVGEGTLRFRGYIDRVDVSPDGRRAYVFDYKTGKPDKYRGLETDPVLRGQHMQMAVYTRAVRAALDKDIEVGGAYWFVTSKGEFRQVALPADPALVEGRLDAALTAVSVGIQQGVFPAVPGEESRGGFSKCDHCPYDRVCTTTRDEEWERKQHDGCAPFLALANGLAEIEENGA